MIYLYLFFEFFKIGLFTFGGGYAMIPLVREVVLNYNWLTEDEFISFLGVCESTPGPIAINMATFVGSTQAGFLGSLVASIGVILPSLIIIIIIAAIFHKLMKNKYVQYFLGGIKPVAIGLICSSGIILLMKSVGYESLETFNFSFRPLAIIALLLILLAIYKFILKKKINTIAFIAIAAVLGLVICSLFEYLNLV